MDNSLIAFFNITVMAVISAFAMLWRLRRGRLLTATGGLHLQIFIFFGMGGLSYLLLPEAEPDLSPPEIYFYVAEYCWPLLLSYALWVLIEVVVFRSGPKREVILTNDGYCKPQFLLFLAGCGLVGAGMSVVFEGTALSSIPGYFGTLFFPCVLLTLTNAFSPHKFNIFLTIGVLSEALFIGIFSPWRSVLIILAATILLALFLRRPSWIPATIVLGLLFLGYMIPFQNAKKYYYGDFLSNPLKPVEISLELKPSERVVETEAFLAGRLNYVRELIYVGRGLDSGLQLQHGKTYESIISQIVPRLLWKDNPALAKWAVNMFAEGVYNFGIWSLLWFVPSVFLIAEGLEALVPRLYRHAQARLLAGVSLFYLLLSQTTVIFTVTFIIAVLFVVKIADLYLYFMRLETKESIRRMTSSTRPPPARPRRELRPLHKP